MGRTGGPAGSAIAAGAAMVLLCWHPGLAFETAVNGNTLYICVYQAALLLWCE